MRPCGIPSKGHYTCTFNPKAVRPSTICPGDRLLLNGVPFNSLPQLDYNINLDDEAKRTDVYLLGDGTTSMRVALEAAKKRAWELVNLYPRSSDVAYGVGLFSEESNRNNGFSHLQSLTTQRSEAVQAIREWTSKSDGRRDKASLVALYRVATDRNIGWRKGSRRVVVYFSDAPGSEPSCVGGKRVDRLNVIRAMRNKRITLVSINLGDMDRKPRPFKCGRGHVGRGQTSALTVRTGGVVVKEKTAQDVVELIRNGVMVIPRKFDVWSKCDDLWFTHTPGIPFERTYPRSQVISNSIFPKPKLCKMWRRLTCQLTYTESGAPLKSTFVELRNVRGCGGPTQR